MTKSYHPSKKKEEKPYPRFTWLLDAKQVITDIAHGEADLDTLKAGASLIPAGKVIKLPKVIKAIGNVGKTGFKKGKEGEKTVWKRFTREDKPKPDKNKGNQSKAGSKSGITTSKPNQEEASKSGQTKQTKARDRGGSGRNVNPEKNASKRTINKKYKRPTHFRKKIRDEVWELAKDKNGIVRDPLTKKVMQKDQPWHMGHKPGYEFRKHQDSAQQRGISRKQFLDEHNTALHYRPELPSSNVSHKGEDKTKKYLGF